VIHVLLVPLAIFGLLGIHLSILWRQKHTQFRGRGRAEHNVVGSKLWPTYAAKSVGLFALVVGVLALLGGLVQINAVWLYGPFDPAAVSTAAQPDWYLGWTEGAIRLFPPWFLQVAGHSVPEVFWPSIALPGVTFVLLYLWPFIEARVTRDHAEHHLLDHPSDRPVRTAIGVGVLTFYVVLTAAGGQDVIAQKTGADIATVTYTLRTLVLVLPILAALITWKFCHDVRASGRLAEEEARTEPPIAPYEVPSSPSEARAALDPEEPGPGPLEPDAPRAVVVAKRAGRVAEITSAVLSVLLGWAMRHRAKKGA
jgi:ubiquinol-cytochrome c reductase cytochrome b subunit